jgi:hypothetical protein
MSEKQKFQEIIQKIRSDLKFIQTLEYKLKTNLIPDIASAFFSSNQLEEDTKEWIIDVYLDKFIETDTKIREFLKDVGSSENENLHKEACIIKENLERVALNLKVLLLPRSNKKELKVYQKYADGLYKWMDQVIASFYSYSTEFERIMIKTRDSLYQTKWSKMKDIRIEDYILTTERRKYVKARDELRQAIQACKSGNWEEILNHLRPAIDLSLQERFGFKDIRYMKTFLANAEDFGLLPAYKLLYLFFDEGSKRLHKGKVHTPLDCQTAVDYVAKFIEYLDFVKIPKKKIIAFKQKYKNVE